MYYRYVYKFRQLDTDGKPFGCMHTFDYSHAQAETFEEAIFLLMDEKTIEITERYCYECHDDEYDDEEGLSHG